MKKTQHILISGRVQGVSYRYYTKSCAEKLKLVGWVRNLKDGRVEVLAQGDAEPLEELRKLLLCGPSLAKVMAIESQFVQHKQIFKCFEIEKDGDTSCTKKHKA